MHPHLRHTYVPVARLLEGHMWRKICVPLNHDINMNYLQLVLCKAFINQTEVDKKNISSSEVWLAQAREKGLYGFNLNNIAEGHCSNFGRELLLLASCSYTKGIQNALLRNLQCWSESGLGLGLNG